MKAETACADVARIAARLTGLTVLALMFGAASAQATATPAQKCQASKELAAGQYALCRLKAEKTLTLTHDATRYDDALTVCQTKLTAAWQKAEQRAAKKGATCADAPFAVGAFALAIDGLAGHVAAALGGAGSPAVCDNSCGGKADGTTCDVGLDFGNTLICVGGTCQACVPDANGVATRFVDNGDGTITDLHTCLVWEKKDDAGSIHDKDSTYAWSTCSDLACSPDGSAFTGFLASLNGSGFAGHRDWRLPSSAGGPQCPAGTAAPEAESLFDASAPGCGDSGVQCVDPLFNTNCGTYLTGNPGCTSDGAGGTQKCSCTALGGGVFGYYSSTPYLCNPLPSGYYNFAWGTNPVLEVPLPIEKSGAYVRAVRGGVVFVP